MGLAEARTPAAAQSERQALGLEEIVVTAQRRSENLQDIPIAISAFSDDSLKKNRIDTTEDLKLVVPSLNYFSANGFAEPYVRGIGTSLSGPNLDPEVATYVDGVFMSNNISTILSLMGVERVEVLDGPQGTPGDNLFP
jgi:iron complex outermembrane receptor protein